MNLLPAEQLAFTTVRIQALLRDGRTSTGTGYFFSFPDPSEEGLAFPILISNKHVIEGANSITFHMTRASASGEPIVGDFVEIAITDISSKVIMHPDNEVDICAFFVGPLLNQAKAQDKPFFYRWLDPTHVPTEAELADLVALEDVIMIGYPIGLWDSANNMPVFRRGVTATHPYLNYESKKEFLVDMACFPGSSGSPVLLYNTTGFGDRNGNYNMGQSRFRLLGTLYAGPQYDAEGELHIVQVPTATKTIAVSQVPVNIGVVIRAERILELEQVMRKAIVAIGA